MVSTRDRMLIGAVDLIKERGVAGVTVDAIVTRSSAPRGSVYYHFPEGRAQIVREALDRAAEIVNAGIEHVTGQGLGSKQALLEFVTVWKALLVDSDFNVGCPFVAATVDGFAVDPELRGPVAGHFSHWQESVTELLVAEGRARPAAQRLARLVIAAISGAVVLCRVERSVAPLDDVAAELGRLLEM